MMNENKKEFVFVINHDSDIPKYQQLVNGINNAIAENILQRGDLLPSVNSICKKNQLSRDTVFKAYTILKDQKVIDSVPNKGYYVSGETRKVLLVLDTFKAYKEVLYDSFVNNLPDNIITDVQFHHYNIDVFKAIINNSVGKYYKYVVMNFDHSDIVPTLSALSRDKLLLIDWNIHAEKKNNYVFQDFGKAFYDALTGAVESFRRYKSLQFIYPNYTQHPKEVLDFFKKFCADFNFEFQIITDPKRFDIEEGIAYISVSDRVLGRFLDQCKVKKLEPGNQVGFLSYNETPMKKFIYKGISVVSTDFEELGTKAAAFITHDEVMQCYITTSLILRESL
jgi:DNA-binding transcriptional regulator YhcF (GntR family)